GVGVAFANTPSAQSAGNNSWLWTLDSRNSAATSDAEICLQAAEAPFYPEFHTFWEAMSLLRRDFYGDLPTSEMATYNAIRGVVNELGDPNTSFLTPDEANLFRTNISGSFEGIGARVDWDEDADTLRITEPFENQPAWTAGLRRGDLVLAVDGESLVGSDLTEAVNRVRGPKGTRVVLTISREAVADPFDVEVTRDQIETPTIATETLGDEHNIAYVKLNTFNQNAGQLVRQAVEDALQRDAQGVIFDLRGNSGGLLREAVKVANIFLEDSTILLERFSDGREEIYQTTGRAVTKDLPLVVLVNEGSASASEIVAGALQDNHRAQLLGTVTYGKGSVQLPHTLEGGSIMRVTVARWYTPHDRTIDGEGLTPDILVEIDEEERNSDRDPQLDAALQLLL
ncbi:MAG: S41 family peptidase, partial [Caldilineaceae bacterium]|nr:S41 family peptidase [Caldilineaceae bacterium]